MNSKKEYYNRIFSHIYVEKDILECDRTKAILEKYKNSRIILIDHYKDIFCRSGQNYIKQQQSMKLILAKKRNELIYEGAKVCQSFGNEHFYYTSCVMNCVYDCEYCYLKGMYSSGNMVIFVNIEDIFSELENILKLHEAYVCVSYDTDLLAIEEVVGYVREWIDFAAKHDNLTIEIRTKCANRAFFRSLNKTQVLNNVIYAFTVSPDEIISTAEHFTASLKARIDCIKAAMEAGCRVRLCFDPMIYVKNYEQVYKNMLDKIFDEIDVEEVVDVSVGSFRVSVDFLKKMRKNNRNSVILQFPYQNDKGVYWYGSIAEEMEQYMVGLLEKRIDKSKIFLWKEE